MSQNKFEYIIQAYDKSASAFSAVTSRAGALADSLTKRLSSALTSPFRALSSMKLFAFTQNISAIAGMVNGAASAVRNMATEYARSQAAIQEFGRRTGATGDQIYVLARRLQEAANGAYVLDSAIERGNAAMARGLNVQQIMKVWEFASIKAKTTREDFESLAESIGTGLATGRVMALNRIGLLMGGSAGVKASFEQQNPGRRWDHLTTAQKKAEMVNQALAEMDAQLKTIGLSGKETVFTFDRLASAWADIKDTVADLVVSSPLIGKAVERARNFAYELRDALSYGFGRFKDLASIVSNAAGGAFSDLVKMFSSMVGLGSDTKVVGTVNKIVATVGHGVLGIVSGINQAKYAFLDLVEIGSVFARQVLMAANPIITMMLNIQKASKEVRREVADAWFGAVQATHKMGDWAKGQKPLAEEGIRKAAQAVADFDAKLRGLPESYEKAAKSAERMLNVKQALAGIPQAWRNFGDGLGGMFARAGGFLADAAKAAGSTADRLKQAFEKAADRVKEAADQLKQAQERLLGVKDDNRARLFNVALERAGGLSTPMGKMIQFQRSGELFDQAKAETDIERKLAKFREAADLLVPLVSDRLLMSNPKINAQLTRAMMMAEGEADRLAVANVAAKQGELGAANMAQHAAKQAMAGDAVKNAAAVAAGGLKEVGGAAKDFAKVMADSIDLVGKAAGRLLFGGGGGNGGATASAMKELGVELGDGGY